MAGRRAMVGELDQRVRLEVATESRSVTTGAVVVAYLPVATVWARVEPVGSREYFAAQAVQADATLRVTLRTRTDITPKHRLVWGAHVLNIVGPTMTGTREPYMTLLCATGVNDG